MNLHNVNMLLPLIYISIEGGIMTKRPVSAQDKFMLRLPDGMREEIAKRADSNGRSMNSEIVQILQDALNDKPINVADIDLQDSDIQEFAIEIKKQLEKKEREIMNTITMFAKALSGKKEGKK